MDKMYEAIKANVFKRFGINIIRRKKYLFDDIVIISNDMIKGKIVSYIYTNYKTYMKLRADIDNTLIYTYLLVNEEKINKIKRQLQNQKQRFKWLYEQIKDEEIFLKTAKVEVNKDAKRIK